MQSTLVHIKSFLKKLRLLYLYIGKIQILTVNDDLQIQSKKLPNSKTKVRIKGNGYGGASLALIDGSYPGYTTTINVDDDVITWLLSENTTHKITKFIIDSNASVLDVEFRKSNGSNVFKYNAPIDLIEIGAEIALKNIQNIPDGGDDSLLEVGTVYRNTSGFLKIKI